PLAGPNGLAAKEQPLEWTILGLRHRIKRSLKSLELRQTEWWKKRRGCWERVFPTKIVSLKVRILLINSYLQGFSSRKFVCLIGISLNYRSSCSLIVLTQVTVFKNSWKCIVSSSTQA